MFFHQKDWRGRILFPTGREEFYLGRQSFFPQAYGIACMEGAEYRVHFDRV